MKMMTSDAASIALRAPPCASRRNGISDSLALRRVIVKRGKGKIGNVFRIRHRRSAHASLAARTSRLPEGVASWGGSFCHVASIVSWQFS